jgi:hypothetical protein
VAGVSSVVAVAGVHGGLLVDVAVLLFCDGLVTVGVCLLMLVVVNAWTFFWQGRLAYGVGRW